MPRPRQYPRIKKGKMIVATKDGAPDDKADQLLANSYMSKHVVAKPEYWSKLLHMLYGRGRLRKYAGAVEDIVDKFSFLMLAKDQIVAYENTLHHEKRFLIKYFAYTYVFMTKSLLDSLAVFLNEIYELGFSGGEIDFKKGKYLEAVRRADPELVKAVDGKRKWLDYVVKYRDSLIHKHGLYIGAIPNVPENMTDPVEIDKFILGEHHYMPSDPDILEDDIIAGKETEFIKVTCLVDEWLTESFGLFDIVLRTFAMRFELASAQQS